MTLISRTVALLSLFLALPFLVHADGGGGPQKPEQGDFKRVVELLTDLEKRVQGNFDKVAGDVNRIFAEINTLSRNYETLRQDNALAASALSNWKKRSSSCARSWTIRRPLTTSAAN